MSLYDEYGTDSVLEQEGAWIEMPHGEGEISRFLIARQGGSNDVFTKALTKAIAPHRKMMRNDKDLPPEVQRQILIDVYSRTIVLDWENVQDKQGNPLKCTPENVAKLLDQIDFVFTIIQDEAQRLSNYQSDQLEEEAKN